MHANTPPVLKLHYFKLTVLCAVLLFDTSKAEPMSDVVRIMSLNLWHGGDAGKQPLDRTIKLIRKSQADVIGL
jgi:hypothetical protein